MILNVSLFPKFTKEGLKYINPSETYMFSLRKWNDADYWYFEFEIGTAFDHNVCEIIPLEILEKIKNDSCTFLVASNSYESFHHIVEPLYQNLIVNNKIPPNKIILISESADLCNEVKNIADKLNLGYVHVEWSLGFERMVKRYKKSQPIKILNTLKYKFYTKKFLNFNRRWRPHRPALVALLHEKQLLTQGYVSLGRSEDNKTWNETKLLINHLHSNTEITDILTNFDTLPDLYLDTYDLITNQAHISSETDHFYTDTYFSVVSETNYYTDNLDSGRFLSEKTFKAVAGFHPFILVTVPYSLPLLKQLGYKSFHPLIDESYDSETNDSARLLKILKEIERLCNLSDDELQYFLTMARPIVMHNFAVLITQSDRTVKTL